MMSLDPPSPWKEAKKGTRTTWRKACCPSTHPHSGEKPRRGRGRGRGRHDDARLSIAPERSLEEDEDEEEEGIISLEP